MEKLTRETLYSLEEYATIRPEFRKQVMDHKKDRQLGVGPNATLYFEDRLTMQYQVQEMLRAERIFEPEGLYAEHTAYHPLIPDGDNGKATFMIEVPDEYERRRVLAGMVGIEDRDWVQVAGQERVYAIADEDMERETAEKTSSVHFLRFDLSPAMVAAAKDGAAIAVGIDHQTYSHAVNPVPANVRDSLMADLD